MSPHERYRRQGAAAVRRRAEAVSRPRLTEKLLRPFVVQALGDAFAPAEFRNRLLPAQTGETMRIFSSAVWRLRLSRRMVLTTFSAASFAVPDLWLIFTPQWSR
jgi:hypothetical protein